MGQTKAVFAWEAVDPVLNLGPGLHKLHPVAEEPAHPEGRGVRQGQPGGAGRGPPGGQDLLHQDTLQPRRLPLGDRPTDEEVPRLPRPPREGLDHHG